MRICIGGAPYEACGVAGIVAGKLLITGVFNPEYEDTDSVFNTLGGFLCEDFAGPLLNPPYLLLSSNSSLWGDVEVASDWPSISDKISR